MSFQNHNQWTMRSKALPGGINIDSNHPLPAHTVSYNFEETNDECDAPLDMSIKRKPMSPHYSCHSPQSNDESRTYNHDSATTVRGRPSVITCAGSWNFDTALPPPPPYSVAAAYAEKHRKANLQMNKTDGMKANLYDSGNKTTRKVFQGNVDPEIDEHFRRSLGTNYHELFANETSKDSQPESNDSVDDHFLKALGSTWTKLKDEEERPEEMLLPLSLTTKSRSDLSHQTSRPWVNSDSLSVNSSNSHLYSSPSPSKSPINLSSKIQREDSVVNYSSSHVRL